MGGEEVAVFFLVDFYFEHDFAFGGGEGGFFGLLEADELVLPGEGVGVGLEEVYIERHGDVVEEGGVEGLAFEDVVDDGAVAEDFLGELGDGGAGFFQFLLDNMADFYVHDCKYKEYMAVWWISLCKKYNRFIEKYFDVYEL